MLHRPIWLYYLYICMCVGVLHPKKKVRILRCIFELWGLMFLTLRTHIRWTPASLVHISFIRVWIRERNFPDLYNFCFMFQRSSPSLIIFWNQLCFPRFFFQKSKSKSKSSRGWELGILPQNGSKEVTWRFEIEINSHPHKIHRLSMILITLIVRSCLYLPKMLFHLSYLHVTLTPNNDIIRFINYSLRFLI